MTNQTFRIPSKDRERIASNLHGFVLSAMPGKELRVEVCQYKKRRTGEQNALAFAWYAEVAAKLAQDSARDVRRYCKLHHGVPIMRTDDAEFRDAYDAVIKPLAYELKLIAMDHWPVTSLMDTTELSLYLEAIQNDYQRQGVFLEFPDNMNNRFAA